MCSDEHKPGEDINTKMGLKLKIKVKLNQNILITSMIHCAHIHPKLHLIRIIDVRLRNAQKIIKNVKNVTA